MCGTCENAAARCQTVVKYGGPLADRLRVHVSSAGDTRRTSTDQAPEYASVRYSNPGIQSYSPRAEATGGDQAVTSEFPRVQRVLQCIQSWAKFRFSGARVLRVLSTRKPCKTVNVYPSTHSKPLAPNPRTKPALPGHPTRGLLPRMRFVPKTD